MRLAITILLLLFAGTAHAGEDLRFTIKFPVSANGKIHKPEVRLGRDDVQIRFDSPTTYALEMGDVEWNHKYPSTLFHRDDYLDIDWSKMYNIDKD